MITNMKRTSASKPTTEAGALYTEKIILTTEAESDVFIFPITRIYSIAASVEGDGVISFSNDSIEDLENDNGVFIDWNGVAEINIGLTAFKVTRNSGTVTVRMTVKTATV